MIRLSLACLFLSAALASAHVRLAPLFGPDMVVQRDKPIPVWGWADPGEKVAVTLGDRSATATAGSDGSWSVRLDPLPAGGPFQLAAEGSDKVLLSNVLCGDVWLCSGQSNMEFILRNAKDADAEIARADLPRVRLCTIGHQVSDEPQAQCAASWKVCSPATAPGFSAVAYFFGSELHRKLDVPIGLVNVSWGGTFIEAWLPRAVLAGDPVFQPILDRFAQQLADYPKAQTDFDARKDDLMKAWQDDVAKAKADGKPAPGQPQPPVGPGSRHTPSGLYNGEIAPLAPFAVKGVVWYQGEQNAGRGWQYRRLLPELIRSWRALWQDEFPFLIVQLPNYGLPKPEPSESGWAELRDAQASALSVPGTGLAVTIDLGEATNVHPTDKKSVGQRLALVAERQAYGLDVAASGPVFASLRADDASVRVAFAEAAGLAARDGGPVTGFAVAGADKKYAWAEGTVDGDGVVLRSPSVPQPLSVRYDWADSPNGNLLNGAGLPARPFRTDDFPLTSSNKK